MDLSQTAFYTHQIFDHQKVLEPITKGSFLAREPIEPILDQALTLMLEDRKGPVHIDISAEVAAIEPRDYRAGPDPSTPAPMTPAPSQDLTAARAVFSQAQRPIAIAGFDVVSQGAQDEVREIVARFRLPLLTTYKAKGILAEDDPLSLGGAGLSPAADRSLHPLLRQSDLILLIGYDPVEMRVGWRSPWGIDTPIIECAAAPSRHGMHQATYLFVGQVALSLNALVETVEPRPLWPCQQPSYTRQALLDHFQSHFSHESWTVYHLFQAARQVIPRDAIVTVDTGAHRILMSQIWTCYHTRTLLQSNGLSTMGCALPLAVGAKLAEPKKPVVAFIGDASFEMILGELATVRDLSLSITIVILVDHSLALIDAKQQALGLRSLGVSFLPTDFPAVARAMGGHGVQVEDRETFIAEIERSFSRTAFTLISCPISARAYQGAHLIMSSFKDRDPRLDFFRGLGMFIIFFAHTPGNIVKQFIPARFGPSDATEVFIFCSGLASALAFGAPSVTPDSGSDSFAS